MNAPRGVERLLNVIMTIGSRRRITRETLFAVIPEYAEATSQAAAERMFERDKRDILDLGLALETETDPWDEGVVHYRIARDGGRLPGLDLTSAEYTVLLAASRAWDDASAGGAARRVRAKLLSLGHDVDEDLVRRTPRGAVESLPVLTPLLEAVTEGRQVTFRYRAAAGHSAERHVEPWVVGVHAGHWYVLGHDRDRGEPRIFRASRIESFPRRRGPRTQPVPPDVSLEAALDRVGSWTDEQADAVLRLEPYKALPLRDTLGLDAATQRAVHPGMHRAAARRLVLGAGRWVTLESPAPWREEIRAVLADVAMLHEGAGDLSVISSARVRVNAAVRASTSSTDHLSRLVGETAFVLARDQVRLEEMAAEFGIGVEDLVRDLQVLFVCGDLGAGWEDLIEVEWEGGWVRVRNADALGGPLRLTPAEATALLAGLGALEPASGGERELIASAREKLMAVLGRAGSTGPAPTAAPEPPRGEPSRSDRVVQGIQEALSEERPVVLRYSPPDAPGTALRHVRPLALESRDGRAYLRALDLQRHEERTFRLDRVVELLDPGTALPVPERTPPPSAPRIREAWLRLEPAAAWIAEAFGAAQVRELPEGTGILALLRDPVVPALVDAVIEGAGAAEVLSPAELRDQIVTVARRAEHRHRAGEPIL